MNINKRLPDKKELSKGRKILYTALSAVFWLAVWQIAAVIAGNGSIIASPLSVAETLIGLFPKATFWVSIWGSLYRIVLGFLAAAAMGILTAALAYKSRIAKTLLSPPMSFLKTAPVVSFIIILAIMLNVIFKNVNGLPAVISFMMVLPIIYTAALAGLENTDRKLLEMAAVFNVPAGKRALYIYVSNAMPFFVSGCRAALGLCWKAGVAAEIIGLVNNSIGLEMYYTKLNLLMSETLAWTFVIIGLSIAFEKLFLWGLSLIKKKIES